MLSNWKYLILDAFGKTHLSLEKIFVTEVAIRRPFHLVFKQNMHEKNFGKTFLNPFLGRAYCSKLCLNKHMEIVYNFYKI